MTDIELLTNISKKKESSKILKIGSSDESAVKALQTILNTFGYGKELSWDIYGADGNYGDCTAKAVDIFCAYNKIKASGRAVSGKTAERIIYLFTITDDLKIINDAIVAGELESRIKENGKYKAGISALQTLLAELGYKRQLKWNKFGADGDFGNCTVSALKKYADDQGYLDTGEELTEKLAESIMLKFRPYFGSEFLRETVAMDDLTKTTTGKNVIISDGSLSWTFRKFKKGLFTYGKKNPKDFIQSHPSTLSNFGLTPSAVNVMLAVSENEGNLDAVNTWDNAFLSFGMFQWTLGTSTNAGELAALLFKLKTKTPIAYLKYFSDYGLEVFQSSDTTGFLSLNGQNLISAAKKEQLRSATWAYRFWKAGQDEFVMAVEVEHAFSRIDGFYKSNSYKVDKYFISDLVTSEYGVALLLDNHVNRPGYLTDTLKNTLKESGLKNPESWKSADEAVFLEKYLEIRKDFGKTPMTDSDRRAMVTKKHVRRGTISDERGSFKI